MTLVLHLPPGFRQWNTILELIGRVNASAMTWCNWPAPPRSLLLADASGKRTAAGWELTLTFAEARPLAVTPLPYADGDMDALRPFWEA